MISKNEAKYIQSLYHKKTREAERLFVAEGPKMVEEILSSSYRVVKLYALEEWEVPPSCTAEVVRVKPDDLQRITGLQTANQVLAVVAQKTGASPLPVDGLSLVLDNIQDPGNLGTIIRIADWFGVKQVIASEHTVELYNPKVIQSTMGSFVRVEVSYRDLPQFLQATKLPIYGAMLEGASVFGLGRVEAGLLVIGNESKGISDAVKALVSHPVTIPRRGGAESLNAAVATGILLSHLLK